MCNLRFNAPIKIPEVFHNGSNYDYHFVTKDLVVKFKGHFECLEKKKKYKTFSVPIEKKPKKMIKMVMRTLQLFLTKYNSLIVQDLGKAQNQSSHYQIFSITSQKKSIKLHVKIAIIFVNPKATVTI